MNEYLILRLGDYAVCELLLAWIGQLWLFLVSPSASAHAVSRSLCLRRRFGRVTCTRILGASGRACTRNPFLTLTYMNNGLLKILILKTQINESPNSFCCTLIHASRILRLWSEIPLTLMPWVSTDTSSDRLIEWFILPLLLFPRFHQVPIEVFYATALCPPSLLSENGRSVTKVNSRHFWK